MADGPFYLPARAEEIPLRQGHALPETITNIAFDLTSLRNPAETAGPWRFQGLVCYGTALFRAVFQVQPSGMVKMEDDELLADDLPLPQRRFDGPFRTAPR